MYKYNTPQELFTAICDKIRDKIGSNELIDHQDIPDKINKLTSDDIKLFIDSAIQGKNTIYYSFNNTTITKISNKIFSTTNLTTIDLPECTSIGYSAFLDCTSLTTVNLPKCTSIGYSAFLGCTSLATVNLPECTTLDYQTFRICTNLTTVNLPNCTFIGEYAFYSCTNLTTIILSSSQRVTLKNINAFTNSSIANGTGYVYVPDNLVESYKTATNWSTYANQIKPISELSN